ncbi:hypothetical protein D3C71_1920230 [compost metagenome]
MLQLSFPSQVHAKAAGVVIQRSADLFARLVILGRTEQGDLITLIDQLLRQSGIVIMRPAFGRAELGAGAKADNRPMIGQVEGGGSFGNLFVADLQLRPQ